MKNTSAEVTNRWNREHYYKINVTVPKGMRQLIQEYAKSRGLSVNSLVNSLLRDEIGMTAQEWGFTSEQLDESALVNESSEDRKERLE